MDIVFLLDSSTSVTEPNFVRMLQFCKDLIAYADIDSGELRVGVLVFSTAAEVMFHLNDFNKKSDIYDAIDEIPYIYGSTNTADALRVMRTEMFTLAHGDRPNADNVAVLIADGVSNFINAQYTVPEAEAAKADSIHIFGIGVGLDDITELNGIVSAPASENRFLVQNFEELNNLADVLYMSSCPGLLNGFGKCIAF